MGVLWFWIVGFMLTVYAILDGFDLGVGVIYLWVARTEPERAQRTSCASNTAPV